MTTKKTTTRKRGPYRKRTLPGREIQVMTRFTPEEHDELVAHCRARELTLAAAIRLALRKAKVIGVKQ